MNNANVQQTKQAIRALGISVFRIDGEWRINYRSSAQFSRASEATAYYTMDNDDAVATAKAMSACAALAKRLMEDA